MKSGLFEEARAEYFLVSKLFNRWKINNATSHVVQGLEEHQGLEFGVDDYIRAKCGYAEAIMKLGHTDEAIEKFITVKDQIENEIVFENP